MTTAFDDFVVTSDTGPTTTLRGDVVDHAALYGVLDRIQRLGLELLDLHLDDDPTPPAPR